MATFIAAATVSGAIGAALLVHAALGPPPACSAPCLEGARVIDGDTFADTGRVAWDGLDRPDGEVRVRLFGIDAPELGERGAAEATAALHELLTTAKRVRCSPRGTSYGRVVAQCRTDTGDVARRLRCEAPDLFKDVPAFSAGLYAEC